jgi:murein L,D-transpeptidase YcbB/YkuD
VARQHCAPYPNPQSACIAGVQAAAKGRAWRFDVSAYCVLAATGKKSRPTQCEHGAFGAEDEIVNSGPILSIGSAGPDVRRLQIIFVMTKVLDVSDIDSQFGPKTQDAVKSFQQGNNLTPDGVVGPLTWQALPADPNTPRLARASTGPAVSALQKGLKAFDGPNTPTDPGQIDGNFGQRTESAVRAYQTRQSIAVDGVVGDQTWWAPAGAAGATLAKLAGLVTA